MIKINRLELEHIIINTIGNALEDEGVKDNGISDYCTDLIMKKIKKFEETNRNIRFGIVGVDS